jgi:hypothetical protein
MPGKGTPAPAAHRPKRSPAAQKVLDNLDAELAASGAARGEKLTWSAAELEMREILADTIDRRARVAALYAKARDPKVVVKLSVEVRQLDNAVMKLLKAIRTDVPAPESLTTIKNRRAANVRWERERQRA